MDRPGRRGEELEQGGRRQAVEPGRALAAARVLLRPLARVLLRHGVGVGAFVEQAKQVFAEVAHQEFALPGRKPSVSRTSVLTGLTRKEVRRLLGAPACVDGGTFYNRATRVATGWAVDPHFSGPEGPRPLHFDRGEPSFCDLVRAKSGDMPARTVLDELLRMGAVEQLDDGRIRLLARGCVPESDNGELLAFLGADVADLIACFDHNMQEVREGAFFQRKVAYDHLVAEALPDLKEHVALHGQALLEKLNAQMAPFDRDVNPDVEGHGRKRAMIGVYYFEEDLHGAADEEGTDA